MQKTNEKKTFSIPLVMVILVVMIITILILSVKAICFSNNSEPQEQEIAVEQEDNKTSEENVLLTKIEEEEENKEETSTQEVENVEEQDVAPTPATKKVKSYTASNGQTYDSIGIVKIPSLGIEYPILATTSDKLLKVSVTKYWGANPNEVGNLCISGHNYKNSKFFGKLRNIKNGDIVQITDLNGQTLDYTVYDTYIVDPEDTSCTSQLTNGNIEVTLITCNYENGNAHATKRFIVKARVQ